MPTAAYKQKSGKRVPGVTKVNGILDKPALMWWAWQQGKEQTEAFLYEELFKLLGPAVNTDVTNYPPGIQHAVFRIVESANRTGHRDRQPALYEKRDEAADAGTLAHELVQADIQGYTYEAVASPEVMAKADQAFRNYQSWAKMVRLEILETELHLVHEELAFGGTPDAVGRVNDMVCLLDWKTGKAVYVDSKLQVAAYVKLLEAHGIECAGGAHVVRFDKESAEFAHYHFSNEALEPAWMAFRLCRELFDLMNALK